jgi:hypothetical protein
VALIYRSILQSRHPHLLDDAHALTTRWLCWKLRVDEIELPVAGVSGVPAPGCEFSWRLVQEEDRAAYQATLFEERQGDQLRTTFVALQGGDVQWAWVDLERWTDTPFNPSFVPIAPGIVGTLLRRANLERAGIPFLARYTALNADGVAAMVGGLLEGGRETPVVVVSPTHEERDGDMAAAEARAREIQRRVAGIAQVNLLMPGAVAELSRALTEELGEGYDVHSGAIRIYLPGLGGETDRPDRHRYIGFRTLRGRPATTAGQIVGRRLVAASTQQAPPSLWRASLRGLVERAAAESDEDILKLLEGDVKEAEAARDAALSRVNGLEEATDAQRTTIDSLQDQVDSLASRVAYLTQVAEQAQPGSSYKQPADVEEIPEWCSDVVAKAAEDLSLVRIHTSCTAGAAELDEHCVPSWAKRAWRSLRALQAYAEAKREGTAPGDFKVFCETSGSPWAIPASWVARHEGQVTKTNARFRRLRTLPVDPTATSDGAASVFMEAHIRIEDGGSPCPRIHYHDDTSGRTGCVHVGWFGDHLDSSAKS